MATLGGPQAQEFDTLEIPLVSILRDTLGDEKPQNDRLRYVWVLTYSRPTAKQKAAAAVPFFYGRAGNKTKSSAEIPRAVLDMSSTEREVWEKFFWMGLQNMFFDPYSLAFKAATRHYGRNLSDYRKTQVARALTALSLYSSDSSVDGSFSVRELEDIQARLSLSDKLFGGTVDETRLEKVFGKQMAMQRDIRGHNWELLRQRAEAESLYFEPLELPDGSATHALLWVSKAELETRRSRQYNGRFLNLRNPWDDDRLRRWEGYTETRYFDSESRIVDKDTPGAFPVEMIPLALYGLDQPKIPMLLIDFRDNLNAKKREISGRVLQDVTRNILSISQYGDVPYFLGKSTFDFVTGRRGIDYNQPPRLQTYSQLKLLLALDGSLNPDLRKEIALRLERVSLNPFENDFKAEVQLARAQYAALLDYAKRPDGLAAQLDRDRREELVAERHNRTEQVLLRLANIASFGIYTHREAPSKDSNESLDVARTMKYYERYLRELVQSSPHIDITADMEEVRRALTFVSEHSSDVTPRITQATAKVFELTEDEEVRSLCLNSLFKIDSESAKKALLAIYRNERTEQRWRNMTADYLGLVVKEDQRVTPADSKTIISVVGQ
jgi:hypothetical protein